MPVAIFSSFSTRAGAERQQGQADPTARGSLNTSPLPFLSTVQGSLWLQMSQASAKDGAYL